MEINILLAYASTHGSTQEVAEAIRAWAGSLAAQLQPVMSH